MSIMLFLCGDVMLGRGIDQILPNPSEPQLWEYYVRDAREYLALATEKNGPIPQPVDFRYVWGDALAELERVNPEFRIVNLETSVTASKSYWLNKDVHYRMNPQNVPCLTEAKIDCAILANNHSLDFGYQGLTETLATLNAAGIKTAGAGQNLAQATEPAILTGCNQKRVLVYAYGHTSSGVNMDWAADEDKPGVNLLRDFSEDTVLSIKKNIAAWKRPGDAVIFSIHWGSNWGYEVEDTHRRFAQKLIDEAGVDVVHGHSSHHVRGIELYRRRLIFYGCGDFLDDYEGISGYEAFRDDLVLMYFLSLSPTDGSLLSLQMTPLQIRNFRLQHAARADAEWLYQLLKREGERLGAQFEFSSENCLRLVC
jgi:poly-gamma-glutamate synthesis protein (capsule biosynthesis protein)